jgi:hypothetical protein
MAERLPDFLVLGTQKGGTTTLQQLLIQHPGVCLAPGKEVHYFSKHWDQPTAWYASHYAGAAPQQRCGDITPFYLFHPQAPKRIHSLLPNAQLIVLLRDPVERALSQYFHSVRLGFETLPLEDALDAEEERLSTGKLQHLQEHSYVSRSRYLEQLDRYLELFPGRQLLVLQSETLFSDPTATWRQIEAFLDLPQAPCPAAAPKANAGQGEARAVTAGIRRDLRRQLEATALGVRERFGFGWDWA